MNKSKNMFAKIKQLIFNIKALVVLLIILVIVGWGLTIYFGVKLGSKENTCIESQAKLEKLNYYSNLLWESMKLIRAQKSLDALEENIRLLDNGTLLAVWEEAVFSGKEQAINDYLDVIIDSLNFFSK